MSTSVFLWRKTCENRDQERCGSSNPRWLPPTQWTCHWANGPTTTLQRTSFFFVNSLQRTSLQEGKRNCNINEYFVRVLTRPHFFNKISKDYEHLYVISILSCSSMNLLWWSKYACIYIKFTLKQLCTMALKVVSMFLERVRCTSAYLFSSLTCTTKN